MCWIYIWRKKKRDENAVNEWSCKWRTWLKKKKRKKKRMKSNENNIMLAIASVTNSFWIILHSQQLFHSGKRTIKILITIKHTNNSHIIPFSFNIINIGNNMCDNLIFFKNCRIHSDDSSFIPSSWQSSAGYLPIYMNTLIFLACFFFFSFDPPDIRIYTSDLRVWSYICMYMIFKINKWMKMRREKSCILFEEFSILTICQFDPI